MEQFKNLAETTLDEALDGSETVITVVDGSVFPSSGNFRVKVDVEFMLCTSRSSNDLTVTRGAEGSSATTHTIGTKTEHIWSKGGYEQSLADLFQTGVYSSRPSTSDVRAPTRYRASDVNLEWVFTGSNWDLIHPCYVPSARKIDTSSWTALNHSTETYTDVNGVLCTTTIPTSGGENIRGFYKSLPSAPYTLNVIVQPPMFIQSYFTVGFGLRQNSNSALKVLGILGDGSVTKCFGANYTNASSFNSEFVSRQPISGCHPIWLQIEDDNTNWHYRISYNGLNYVQLAQETRNTFATADKVWIGFNYVQTTFALAACQHYAYWEV